MHKLNALFAAASLLASLSLSVNAAQADDAPAASSEPVLQLGTVQVTGQRQVLAALQAIKVDLKRPESSDPSQQNAVVCRIETDIGTHHQQFLTCATNRTLSQRRQAIQNSILMACEGVQGTSCSASQAFGDRSSLGTAIDATSDHVMRMPVNGAALKNLLAKIPEAVTAAAPQAATSVMPAASSATPAPAAGTATGHN